MAMPYPTTRLNGSLPFCRRGMLPISPAMSEPTDFHVHLYFDPEQVDLARSVAAEVAGAFGAAVGHFHLRPVGPHPRGSV